MISALARSGWQGLFTHPWQLGLAVVGVMMGVAVVVGVDLTRASAMRAMTLSNEAVLGRATHRIAKAQGFLEEHHYFRLRKALRGHAQLTPVVEGWVSATGSGTVLRVLGVDPLSEAPFQRISIHSQLWTDGRAFVDLMAVPGVAYLSSQTADREQWSMGSRVSVLTNGVATEIVIGGWLDDAAGSEDLLLMDIASAQELMGSFGRISHIDLRMNDPAAAQALLSPLLADDLELQAVGTQLANTISMTRSFFTNLTALSLLAALVGSFLVFNTMSFLVLQRRSEIGILRSLGATANEILRRTLWEALGIGLGASLLGLAAGIALAHALVGLVTQTINDLYYSVSVRELDVTTGLLLKALLVGVGSSVIAAAMPAYRAGQQSPRSVMRRSSVDETAGISVRHALFVAGIVFVVGTVLLAGPTKSVTAGFVGLFLLIIGFAVLTPVVLRLALEKSVKWRWLSISVRTSLACARASVGRLSLASAALMVSLSAVVGIGLMILSFRQSVDEWLGQLLRADVYISVAGPENAVAETAIDGLFVERLRRSPGVEAVTSVWSTRVEGRFESQSVTWAMAVYDLSQIAFEGFQLLDGDAATAWSAFNSGAVMVSEPFERRFGIGRGDQIPLQTESGIQWIDVAAVYRDYGSQRGVIAMNRGAYAQLFAPPGIRGLGVYLAAGEDMATARTALTKANVKQLALFIQESRKIRVQSMAVFDRTFAVTQALRALAALVAVVGVFSALIALQIERAREFGMLRAVGFRRLDLIKMSLVQCGLIGLVAGLMSIPAGLAICLGLIDGINLRSFGWSVDLTWQWEIVAGGVLLAVGSALVAGVLPALRLSRIPITQLRRG